MTRRKSRPRKPQRKRPSSSDPIQVTQQVAQAIEEATAFAVESTTNGWTPFDPENNALLRVTKLINEETDKDYKLQTIDGYDDAVCGYDFDGQKYRLHYCLGSMQYCCMRRGLSEADAYEELQEVVIKNLPHDGPRVIQHSVNPTISLLPELLDFVRTVQQAQEAIGLFSE